MARGDSQSLNSAARKNPYAKIVRVKSGDTLGKIAKAYGTTVSAIYKANPALAKRKAAGQVTIFANSAVKIPLNASKLPKAGPSKEYGGSPAPKKTPKTGPSSSNYGPGKIPVAPKKPKAPKAGSSNYGPGKIPVAPSMKGNAGPGNVPKRAPKSNNYGPGKIPVAPKKTRPASKLFGAGNVSVAPMPTYKGSLKMSNYGAGKIPLAAAKRSTKRGN